MTSPAAATRTPPRTVAPRVPRRVSGPQPRTRRGGQAAGARRRAHASGPFVLRALHRIRQLADSRFLDRLIRGRLWIPLVAAGLMGIVFMQVTMLKLNAGIGRAVTSAATLERQNAAMRAEVSGMEAGSRIDSAAQDLGMVVPADGSTNYVRVTGGRQAGTAASKVTPAAADAIARTQAGSALAAGQASTTATTSSASAAAAPAQTETQSPAGTVAAPPQATTPAPQTSTATSGTGTATGAGTTGTTGAASTPPAVTQQPSATGTTGAAAAPTQQQAQAAAAPTTSGGAVAPTPQG